MDTVEDNELHLHDLVGYQGLCYFVLGFTPMSVTPGRVKLLDALTGERVTALERDLVAAPESQAAA